MISANVPRSVIKMKRTYWLCAALLALSVSAGCNLKVYQLEKRIGRWESMQRKDTKPEKMAAFATESILFFLRSSQLQRTQEADISQQARLNYHRKLTSMQVYLVSLHASRAVAAVDRPDPDWELGQAEWILADSLTLGRIPGHSTQFSMVHVQEGYNALVNELILHPENYDQTTRDFPGLIQALRTMSRFVFLEANKNLAAGQLDLAIEKFEQVFSMDFENFAAADRTVRSFTGQGIRAKVVSNFWRDRYQQTFESDRMEAYSMVSEGLGQLAQDLGEEAVDSMMNVVFNNVSENFRTTGEQTADLYYYIRSVQQGNLPEYMRLWRHQVLEGNKPLRAPFSE
jgi:hypothetical protein